MPALARRMAAEALGRREKARRRKKVFKLEIDTNSAAFEGEPGLEISRILSELSETISMVPRQVAGAIRDLNGKTVGKWELIE